MQDDVGISREHEILTTCIPTLIKHLEKEQKAKNGLLSHIQILDPDIQNKNKLKLEEIQTEIESDRKQTNNQFLHLEEKINELKSLFKEQNNSSNPALEPEKTLSSLKNESSESNNIDKQYLDNTSNSKLLKPENIQSEGQLYSDNCTQANTYNRAFISESERNIDNSFNLINNEPESGLYNETSDRNTNNNPELTNEPKEGSLGRENTEFSNTIISQESNQTEITSHGSYQSFYHLIKSGQIKVIKVKVPQETVEQMRSGTQSELKFASDNKGNYWIVNWHDTYCLIPKEKTYINPHQYGNFQRVFDCEHYQETYQDFEVIEPATVVNCDGEIWRLERKGKIKFI